VFRNKKKRKRKSIASRGKRKKACYALLAKTCGHLKSRVSLSGKLSVGRYVNIKIVAATAAIRRVRVHAHASHFLKPSLHAKEKMIAVRAWLRGHTGAVTDLPAFVIPMR
jgi:hypothetical protein